MSPGGQRSPANISLLPTKEIFSKLGELNRTKRLGEDVSELVFGSDRNNVDDAWFEMLPKPMVFYCDALGTWCHSGRIGGREGQTSLIVFENGGLD